MALDAWLLVPLATTALFGYVSAVTLLNEGRGPGAEYQALWWASTACVEALSLGRLLAWELGTTDASFHIILTGLGILAFGYGAASLLGYARSLRDPERPLRVALVGPAYGLAILAIYLWAAPSDVERHLWHTNIIYDQLTSIQAVLLTIPVLAPPAYAAIEGWRQRGGAGTAWRTRVVLATAAPLAILTSRILVQTDASFPVALDGISLGLMGTACLCALIAYASAWPEEAPRRYAAARARTRDLL